MTCRKCKQTIRPGQAYKLAKGRSQGVAHEHCPPKLVLVKS